MRFVRKFMVAVVLAAVTAVLLPAAPAQAGPREVTVCTGLEWTGTRWEAQCFTIVIFEHEPKPSWPDDCWQCPPSFDFLRDEIDPKIRFEYFTRFNEAFAINAQALVTEDPEETQQLRERAVRLFLNAADVIGKADFGLRQVGWFDRESGKFFEDSNDLLVSAGKHLVEGQQLMLEALHGGPSPQPSIEAAMHQFDLAHAALNRLYAG